MSRAIAGRRVREAIVGLLLPLQVAAAVPLSAQSTARAAATASAPSQTEPEPSPEPTSVPTSVPPSAPPVQVNHVIPPTEHMPAFPVFSSPASMAELTEARVFGEPLLPLGTPSSEENQALATAVSSYLHGADHEVTTPLDAFLTVFPQSAWRASLLANMGATLHRRLLVTRAQALLEEAWTLSKDAPHPTARAVAHLALAELLAMHMTFGHQQALEDLLAQAQGHEWGGTASTMVTEAGLAVTGLQEEHHHALPSGPIALGELLRHLDLGNYGHPKLQEFHATPNGASLVEIQDLGLRVGLHLRRVVLQRAQEGPRLGTSGAPASQKPAFDVPIPSIAHLRAKHFAAVIGRSGERYLLSDPLLGGEVWISARALAEESTGFFLVLAGGDTAATRARSKHGASSMAFTDARLPQGWREATNDEAMQVRGKCTFPGVEIEATYCEAPKSGGRDQNCPGCKGMAEYAFLTAHAALRISDTPLGYEPPRGQPVNFSPVYNQHEVGQPAVFTFTNLGPRWSFSWLSWVQDDPSNLTGSARVFRRGGGQEVATGFNSGTSSYAPDTRTRAVLVRTSTNPIRYERRMADGSVDVYAEADGAAVSPRRVFLTESRDPQGRTTTFHYAKGPKLVAVTDALGQVTTLYYDSGSDKYKVTRVVDPFGREARLEYRVSPDGTNQLVKIVDVIGMESSFEYGADNFITALTTPYGTTRFRWSKDFNLLNHTTARWVEATDPLGGTERVEYRFSVATTAVPASDAAAPVGFSYNQYLNLRNSFYWDKRAWALYPGDYTKAQITHWLWSGTLTIAPVPASTKLPLEGRVWHEHEGASMLGGISPIGRPARIGRMLDDNSSQVTHYEYNSKGRVTRVTDPRGRATRYLYAANEIDLEEVRQVTGSSTTDLLAKLEYNGPPHLPSKVTDAAGQATTLTYDAQSRPQTVVTPARNGPNGSPLTLAERTTTYAYFTDNAASGPGRLQTITGPSTPQGSPTTSFTYDSYGRMRTVTEPDGYSVTLDYDALDRPTRTTFADGTSTQTRYNRLDPEGTKDRLNRWTTTFHDALGRVIAQRDPAGRMTSMEWCTCGSLDKLIDANGHATTWERDVQGRITREIRPDNAAWQYAYEPKSGRLRTRTDPKGQVTTYTYVVDDQLASMAYTNTSVATATVSFDYDLTYDRVNTMTDGIGTTTYGYHAITPPAPGAGQLASASGPLSSSTVSYTYDELGRVATHGLSDAVSTWKYDALGRPANLTHPIGTFTYGYDGVTARPLTLTYPNNQSTAYAYLGHTGDHRLQEIKHLAPGGAVLSKFNYGYDAVGNITTWTQHYAPDPAKVYSFGYDRADQLTAATLRSTDTTPVLLKRYGYAYDPAGNRTAEQVDDAVTGASYNARNELLSRQAGGAMFFRGALNEAGTVTVNGQAATVTAAPGNAFEAQVVLPSGTSTVSVVAKDAANNQRTNSYQVTSSSTTTTYTHDANGNLTSDGTKTYEWDAENRLVRVCTGACAGNGSTDIARFAYDGLGRRVRKIVGATTLEYVYDGAEIAEERSSSGTNLRFVHGTGIDQHWAQYVSTSPSSPTYLLADHLGSIVQQTNTAGAVTFTRQYDAWGNLLVGASAGRYAYTGREWDPETGLFYYRARYYSPATGRFMSEDPIGFKGGANVFAYVNNRTTIFVDPSGLAAGNAYPNKNEAAKDALCEIFVQTKRVEMCGNICALPEGGYTYDPPRKGTATGCTESLPPVCDGGQKPAASYHSHPDQGSAADNYPSTDDNLTASCFLGKCQPVYFIGPNGERQKVRTNQTRRSLGPCEEDCK